MRWKKMVSALLIGAMVCTMGACGSSGSKDSTQGGSKTSSKGDNKLVVWTLTNDLVDYGKRFQEQTGVKVDTVVIEPADYPTKVQTALLAGETEPDIIVGEPQMLDDFYEVEKKEGDKDLIVLNPGSLSYPRQDGHKPSFMLMEIDKEGEAHFSLNFL